MKNIIITFILLFSINIYAQNNANEISVNLEGKLQDYKFNYNENKTFMPVTITKYSKNLYLTANYTDVFLLNTSTNDVYKFKLINDVYKFIAQSDKKEKVLDVSKLTFVPTGLFYSKVNKKLYIANYKGNNILIFDVDIENKTLLYGGEIKTKHTIGPENVYVTKDGKKLATACYDGSTITFFSLSSPIKYKELWTTKIGQAHGVCILDNKVYATGLTKRKIYKLNIKTGKIEKSIGNIDSDPKNDGFLWPTSVYPLNSKKLVVSDAHTGYIYVLNKNSLEIEEYFGGNGPTYKYLHMPYGIIINKDNYVITSSFQDRIIIGNTKNWNAQKSFIFKGRDWKNTKTAKVKSLIKQYNIYNYKKGPKIDIFNHKYTLGFGHLFSVKQNFPVMRLPNIATLNNDSAYFYFTDMIKRDNIKIIFSPESQALVLLINSQGINYIIPCKLDSTDYWNIDNTLINSKGKFDLSKIIKITNKKVKQLENKRLKNGLLNSKDLYNIVYDNLKRPFLSLKYKEFQKRFNDVFVSNEGKVFYKKYIQFLKDLKVASKENVEKIALGYYKKAIKSAYVDMNEFIMVQTLTGFKDFNKLYKQKLKHIFSKCKGAKYYKDYTPKVLETPSINDYTSPFGIKDSCFNIQLSRAITPTQLSLMWYSPDIYGVDFKLYGIKKDKKELLLEIKNNKPFISQGLAKNNFKIKTKNKYNRFKFVATKTSKQNRLLLREFRLSNDKIIESKNKQPLTKDEIIKLNSKVHNSISYGNGKNYYPLTKKGADYYDEILKVGNGHCGNYIYMLYRELDGRNKWIGYDLKTWDGRIHSVLEVKLKDGWVTFDPTLGVYYQGRVNQLIENPISIDKDVCRNIDTKFKGYCGRSFFSAINKLKSYKTFEDYEPNKFNKENIISIKANGEIKGYTTKALYDGDRNTYFSSNGKTIEIDLKPIKIYKISLEGYRYFDIKNNKEVFISPKKIQIKTYYNGELTNNIKKILKPFLYQEIYLNSGLVEKIKIEVDGMSNSNSSFILRSLKIF